MPKKAHAVWQEFSDGATALQKKCRHCAGTVSSNSATRLVDHILNKCPKISDQAKRPYRQNAEEKAKAEKEKEVRDALVQRAVQSQRTLTTVPRPGRDSCDDAWAKCVVANGLPFALTDDPLFRRFCDSLRPGYTPPGRQKLSEILLEKLYTAEEETQTECLLKESHRGWTCASDASQFRSGGRLFHLHVVVAVLSSGKTIPLRAVVLRAESHTAQEVFDTLNGVRARFADAFAACVGVVSDAGGACLSGSRRFAAQLGVPAMWCVAHQINRLVFDTVGRYVDAAGVEHPRPFYPLDAGVRRLVAQLSNTERLQLKFDEYARARMGAGTKVTIPRSPSETRWLSVFPLYDFVVKYQAILVLMLNDPAVADELRYAADLLQGEKWTALKVLRDFFSVCQKAILWGERDAAPASHVLPIFRKLCSVAATAVEQMPAEWRERMRTVEASAQKRYDRYEKEDWIRAALFLNPLVHAALPPSRLNFKEGSLAEFFLTDVRTEGLRHRQAAERYLRTKVPAEALQLGTTLAQLQAHAGAFANGDVWLLNPADAPDWWRTVEILLSGTHPGLCKTAFGLSAVSANSAAPERLFSTCSWQSAARRRSMRDEKLGRLSTLAFWLRSDEPRPGSKRSREEPCLSVEVDAGLQEDDSDVVLELLPEPDDDAYLPPAVPPPSQPAPATQAAENPIIIIE